MDEAFRDQVGKLDEEFGEISLIIMIFFTAMLFSVLIEHECLERRLRIT